jgi:ATP-binding cassette, subfamily C (CFTR/MRP), member 1
LHLHGFPFFYLQTVTDLDLTIHRHLLLVIVVVSGKKLHSSLLRTVLHAPMSFFATTDVGSIINRFSQDIQLIDAELPIAFLNTCANGFAVIAQAIMLIPASYWLVLTYPFLFGILWAVQKYYLRTSRQLRFLDLEAKSPLYSQFLETLGGLTTIRAFQWQDELVSLNDRRLDFSQKPFYLLFSVQRWLNLVLDLITSALAVILTAVSINLRGQVSPGFAGVALYNVMTLSAAMKAAVTVWTVLETSIGAVARVKSFDETTPSEHLPEETGSLPDNWPGKGAIELSGVAASYK